MITKIRMSGSSDMIMPLLSPPPKAEQQACANAGVISIAPPGPLWDAPALADTGRFAREIGADYSGRCPNCNVAARPCRRACGVPAAPLQHDPESGRNPV